MPRKLSTIAVVAVTMLALHGCGSTVNLAKMIEGENPKSVVFTTEPEGAICDFTLDQKPWHKEVQTPITLKVGNYIDWLTISCKKDGYKSLTILTDTFFYLAMVYNGSKSSVWAHGGKFPINRSDEIRIDLADDPHESPPSYISVPLEKKE